MNSSCTPAGSRQRIPQARSSKAVADLAVGDTVYDPELGQALAVAQLLNRGVLPCTTVRRHIKRGARRAGAFHASWLS